MITSIPSCVSSSRALADSASSVISLSRTAVGATWRVDSSPNRVWSARRITSRATRIIACFAATLFESAWADRELWAPCFQVDVVGTTGAGDATVAGFLGGLLRDLAPEDVVTAAVAVGACNVEASDALSGIRPWEETMARVRAGWPRRWFEMEAPGWHRDERHHLWVKERESCESAGIG